MERYNNVWRTVAAVAAAIGLFFAVERLGATAAVTLYVLSAMLVAALTAAVQRGEAQHAWRAAVRPGLVGGALGLAAFGIMFLFGNAGAVVILAGFAFSPPVLRWFGRHLGHGGQHPHRRAGHGPVPADDILPSPLPAVRPTPPSADRPASKPEAMSDADLCREWRKSYVMLQQSGSVAAQLLVVQQRQRYLDELERRNASGLSGWLSSGPRAAGDPSRYIVPGEDPGEPPAA